MVRVRIRGWSKDSDKQPTPMDVSDALEKLKGQEKGLAKEYTAQELALVSRKQRLNEAARVAQKARRGKLGKRQWQKRREARDKTGPVVCLCEYKGPAGIPCDKVPSPKCVHTKCVAAAKEKAKHAQAEEEQRKKAEEEVSSRPQPLEMTFSMGPHSHPSIWFWGAGKGRGRGSRGLGD